MPSFSWSRAHATVAALCLAGPLTVATRGYVRAGAIVHFPRTHVTPAETTEARRALPGLEEVRFTTSDGLALRGWFAPGPKRATVIFVHGGGGNRAQLLPDAEVLARHGYGVLTYDSRASGDSDGDLDTWGDREQRDLVAAVDYVSARADVDPSRIGVVGHSIGASTVALEAARDHRVRAVCLYATWTSLEDETYAKFGRFGALSWAPVVWRLRAEGVDLAHVRPIDHVAEIAPRPLLMIAGTRDADTPLDVMQRVFAAARGPKELWVEEGAEHGTDEETNPAEYERRVVGFFDRSL